MTLTDIRAATLRDMSYIAANMRGEDEREIAAVMTQPPEIVAAMLYESSPRWRWVAFRDGQPACTFGIAELFEGVGSGWAYGTKHMPLVMPAATRFILRHVVPQMLEAGYRRVEVRSAEGHVLSHRWLERLGFRREGIAVAFGSGGLDFVTYARTASTPRL